MGYIFRNDGHTPETTYGYTIKTRAFRRDYIRTKIEMYNYYLWKYMEEADHGV